MLVDDAAVVGDGECAAGCSGGGVGGEDAVDAAGAGGVERLGGEGRGDGAAGEKSEVRSHGQSAARTPCT